MTSTPLHQGPAKIISFATGREIQPERQHGDEQQERDHDSHLHDPVSFNSVLAQMEADMTAIVQDALNGEEPPKGAA